MRLAANTNITALSFKSQTGQKNFPSQMISCYSSAEFTRNNNYLISKDFLTVKIWDVCNVKKPVNIIVLQQVMKGKLCQMFENDCIFDKFALSASPDSNIHNTNSISKKLLFLKQLPILNEAQYRKWITQEKYWQEISIQRKICQPQHLQTAFMFTLCDLLLDHTFDVMIYYLKYFAHQTNQLMIQRFNIFTLQFLLIMNKTFREHYNQQQDLESGLAQAWGYSLANTSIDIKEKKHIQASRPIVANINPRKFGKDIQKTQKIKQVQDEIRGLENERMLRELKQSKYEEPSLDQKSEIICLMENMIEDYNNIVHHKHITNRKHLRLEQKDRIHELKKKENEKLLETIDSKKKLLLNADLKQHIKINKEIAQLYRQYNDIQCNLSAISLKNNQSMPPEMPASYKTMKKHQSQTFEKLQQLASIQNMNKFLSMKMSNSDEELKEMASLFKRNSDISGSIDNELIKKRFKQLQFKKFTAGKRKQSMNLQHNFGTSPYSTENKSKKAAKKDYQKQIQQPYLDKKSVEQYKQMQKKIRSNSQALQIWKSKINDASQNSRLQKQADRVKQMNKRKAEIEMQHREQQIEHILENSVNILDIDPVNSDSVFTRELRQNQRNHQVQKERIFAELLRKKNNKFNKLWGTKILVKYDSGKQAKSMLKGADEMKSTRKVKSSMSHRRNLSFSSRVGDRDVSRLNRTQQFPLKGARSQRINAVESDVGWIEQQKDEQHYWRMCKNQKINLLLKRR